MLQERMGHVPGRVFERVFVLPRERAPLPGEGLELALFERTANEAVDPQFKAGQGESSPTLEAQPESQLRRAE
jgi:hypothetical protein